MAPEHPDWPYTVPWARNPVTTETVTVTIRVYGITHDTAYQDHEPPPLERRAYPSPTWSRSAPRRPPQLHRPPRRWKARPRERTHTHTPNPGG